MRVILEHRDLALTKSKTDEVDDVYMTRRR